MAINVSLTTQSDVDCTDSDFQVDTISLGVSLFSIVTLAFIFVLGLSGNVLVGLSLVRNKALRTANNALLASLAISDLITVLINVPLIFHIVLHNSPDLMYVECGSPISPTLCKTQVFFMTDCSFVQFTTLAIISSERYRAVAHPFQTKYKPQRIGIYIGLSWTLGLGYGLLLAIGFYTSTVYLLCSGMTLDDYNSYQDPFGYYFLAPIGGLSMLIIVIYYLKIFQCVRTHVSNVQNNNFSHSIKVINVPSKPNPTASETIGKNQTEILSEAISQSSTVPPPQVVLSDSSPNQNTNQNGGQIYGSVCIMNPKAKERGRARIEARTAQRALYVILLFCVSWIPFIVVTFVIGFHANVLHSKGMFFDLTIPVVVLSQLSSSLNFFFYVAVNKTFKSEFQDILKKLLCCKQNNR